MAFLSNSLLAMTLSFLTLITSSSEAITQLDRAMKVGWDESDETRLSLRRILEKSNDCDKDCLFKDIKRSVNREIQLSAIWALQKKLDKQQLNAITDLLVDTNASLSQREFYLVILIISEDDICNLYNYLKSIKYKDINIEQLALIFRWCAMHDLAVTSHKTSDWYNFLNNILEIATKKLMEPNKDYDTLVSRRVLVSFALTESFKKESTKENRINLYLSVFSQYEDYVNSDLHRPIFEQMRGIFLEQPELGAKIIEATWKEAVPAKRKLILLSLWSAGVRNNDAINKFLKISKYTELAEFDTLLAGYTNFYSLEMRNLMNELRLTAQDEEERRKSQKNGQQKSEKSSKSGK